MWGHRAASSPAPLNHRIPPGEARATNVTHKDGQLVHHLHRDGRPAAAAREPAVALVALSAGYGAMLRTQAVQSRDVIAQAPVVGMLRSKSLARPNGTTRPA
jgi:hypothetical protein